MPKSPEFDPGLSFWKDFFAPRRDVSGVLIDSDDEWLMEGRRDAKFLDPSQDTMPLGEVWLEKPDNKPDSSD